MAHEEANGQGAQDRQRYQDKIRDRLRAKLPEIAGHAPLIGGADSDGITIPIDDGLTLPRYKAAAPTNADADGVGQGPGQPGDVVGTRPRTGPDSQVPGGQPAEHPVIVDLSLAELRALIREDLALPPLPPKASGQEHTPDIRWTTRARKGAISQVDLRSSLKQALLRTQAAQQPLSLHPDDLRYRSYLERPRPRSQAVVCFLRDSSGSMTEDRRYLSQVAAWYLAEAVRSQYTTVAMRFFVHDTEAQETDEMDFYHLDSGGGTLFAPAYQTIQEVVDTDYPVSQWHRLIFQFSDGDVGDADRARALLGSWLPSLYQFGFLLTKPALYGTTRRKMQEWSDGFADAVFSLVTMASRDDVLYALRDLVAQWGKGESA